LKDRLGEKEMSLTMIQTGSMVSMPRSVQVHAWSLTTTALVWHRKPNISKCSSPYAASRVSIRWILQAPTQMPTHPERSQTKSSKTAVSLPHASTTRSPKKKRTHSNNQGQLLGEVLQLEQGADE
jgi:hypothetical protein